MNTLSTFFGFILAFLIGSYAFGLILGDPKKANKIITWELKQLARFGRWIMKHLFLIIAKTFHGLAKKCEPKKAKKP